MANCLKQQMEEGMYKRLVLNEDELEKLDPTWSWYESGDTVILSGNLPDEDNDDPEFDLEVSGLKYDRWIPWVGLPKWLQERLIRA
jgi:hypothetical protein